MTASTAPLHRIRSHRTLRAVGLWVFVALLLFKASIPWLASLAAHSAGVAVGDICSVYGVRAADASHGTKTPGDSQHAGAEHCPLSPALTAHVPTLGRLPAVVLHAPAQRVFAPPSTVIASWPDRSLSWLALHLHAPPPTV